MLATSSTTATSRPAAAKPQHPAQLQLAELLQLQHSAKQLAQRNKHRSKASTSGMHAAVFRARGMEFEEHRAYIPGDDIRNIDWRVTARTGTAHSKLFREERERPVLIAIDQGQSMQFATRGRFKAVRAAEAGVIAAWLAAAQGDRVGGLIAGGEFHRELRPAAGKHGCLQLIRSLLALQENDASASAQATNLATLLSRLAHVAHPGAQAFIFSDFAQWNEAAERQLRLLCQHVPTTLGMVYDPIDQALPEQASGILQFSHRGERGQINASSKAAKRAYAAQFSERLAKLKQAALSNRCGWLMLPTTQPAVEVFQEAYAGQRK